MPHTLFIADLHLAENHQTSTDVFSHFIKTHAPKADACYILGDLFEAWPGDDDTTLYNENIKAQLKSLTNHGIRVYFLPGNRDFLLGKKFAKTTGCQLLADSTVIQLYDHKVLLTHGDALCSLDHKHMKFRKLTQNRLFQKIILALPLRVRKNIATKLRTKSQQHVGQLPFSIMDVVPTDVMQTLRAHEVKNIIHGHTHRPQFVNFQLDGAPAQRIVLGAWEQQGCALKWYKTGKKELMFF